MKVEKFEPDKASWQFQIVRILMVNLTSVFFCKKFPPLFFLSFIFSSLASYLSRLLYPFSPLTYFLCSLFSPFPLSFLHFSVLFPFLFFLYNFFCHYPLISFPSFYVTPLLFSLTSPSRLPSLSLLLPHFFLLFSFSPSFFFSEVIPH